MPVVITIAIFGFLIAWVQILEGLFCLIRFLRRRRRVRQASLPLAFPKPQR